MPRGQKIRLASFVFCIMAIVAVRAQGQQFQTQQFRVAQRQTPQYQTRQAATSRTASQNAAAKTFYFGVMGRVARPGVYELKSRFPSIVDLIQRSGGLTSDASGNIRIIRNGRAGQQTFYSPKLRLSLLPGDLIVVNSRRSNRSSSAKVNRIWTGSRTNSSRQDESPPQVELAFVNLIDRPVVLSIRNEHATLPAVVSLLGQFEDVALSVNVIPAYSTHKRGESYKDGSTALPSGSVLVFDRSTVDVNRMPRLPAPFSLKTLETLYRGQAAAPRPLQFQPYGGMRQPGFGANYDQRSFIPTSSMSNPNPAPTAQHMPKPVYQPRPTLSQRPAATYESLPAPAHAFVTWPNRATTNSQPSARSTADAPSGHVRIQSKPSEAPAKFAAVASEPVVTATAPKQPQSRTSTRSNSGNYHAAIDGTKSVPASQQAGSVHQRNHANQTISPTQRIDDAAHAHVTEPQPRSSQQTAAVEDVAGTTAVRPKRKRRTQAEWVGIWGIGFVVVGIAFTLLWSMAKQDTTPKTFEKSDRYYLDAVINDELTVTEEALSLPTTLQFYGRPVTPKTFRLDTAHQPTKPKTDRERPESQFAGASPGPHFKSGPPKPHFATAAAAEKSTSAPRPAMTRSYLREAAATAVRSEPQPTTPKPNTAIAPHATAESAAKPSTAATTEPTNGLLDRVLSSVHGGPRQ